jgi:hypothetical protein
VLVLLGVLPLLGLQAQLQAGVYRGLKGRRMLLRIAASCQRYCPRRQHGWQHRHWRQRLLLILRWLLLVLLLLRLLLNVHVFEVCPRLVCICQLVGQHWNRIRWQPQGP